MHDQGDGQWSKPLISYESCTSVSRPELVLENIDELCEIVRNHEPYTFVISHVSKLSRNEGSRESNSPYLQAPVSFRDNEQVLVNMESNGIDDFEILEASLQTPKRLPEQETSGSSTSTTELQTSCSSESKESYIDVWRRPESAFSMNKGPLPVTKEERVASETIAAGLGLIEDKTSWERNVCGYRMISLQVQFHPEEVLERLPSLIIAILCHMSSSVSRVTHQAILTLRDLCIELGPHFDSHLSLLIDRLLSKMMNANKFIKKDCAETLDEMITHCSHSRMIQTLESHAKESKHAGKRLVACKLMTKIITFVGTELSLEDYGELILPLLCKNLGGRTAEIRDEAKKGLIQLLTHPKFDQYLKQNVNSELISSVRKILDHVRDEATHTQAQIPELTKNITNMNKPTKTRNMSKGLLKRIKK